MARSLMGRWTIAADGDTLLVGLTGNGQGLFHSYDACDCLCPADVDNNGMVNVNDVLVVIAEFGTTNPLGDVNGDGFVTVTDLLLVLDSYGNNCN